MNFLCFCLVVGLPLFFYSFIYLFIYLFKKTVWQACQHGFS